MAKPTTLTAAPVKAAATARTNRSAGEAGGTEITLITGERVLETHDAAGHPQFSVAAGGTPHTPVFVSQIRAARYLIDSGALPFVGSELDPALFEGTLATGGSHDGTAVVIHWHGPSTPSMLWLMGRHDQAAGVTSGVIASSSGAQFRAALALEPASSRGSRSGPLRGIDQIGLPSGVVPSLLQPPDFLERALTIDGVNSLGRRTQRMP